MFENDSIRQRLARIFEDDLGLEVPAADADLFNSGIMDSLAFVDMLLKIEHEFDITLSLDTVEFDRFKSIESIAEFIASRHHMDTAYVPDETVAHGMSR